MGMVLVDFVQGGCGLIGKPGGSVGVDVLSDWLVSCESQFFASTLDGDTDDLRGCSRAGVVLESWKASGISVHSVANAFSVRKWEKLCKQPLYLQKQFFFPGDSE